MTGVRPAMSWLHSWLGLILGWLLFVMFVTGSCGYYRHEITQWMTPELQPLAGAAVEDVVAARRGVDWLAVHAPGAEHWTITLPDERSPALRVAWESGDPGTESRETLDPRNGQPLRPAPRETRGGEFLYRLHSDLHFIPAIAGRVIVSLAGIALLVILVSGLFTHRNIIRNLFRFRRGKGRRTWLDAHNLFGVLALPFHLLVTYTGLVTVMILIMPWGIVSNYAGEGLSGFARDAFEQTAEPSAGPGQPSALVPIEQVMSAARGHWRGDHVGEIRIDYPGNTRARIEVAHDIRGVLAMRKPAITFSGTTGKPLATANEDLSSAALLHSQAFGLHVAHFAGPVTRLSLFLLGLIGAAMVATGLIIWSMKRSRSLDEQRPPLSIRLVETLNLGVIAGLPVAIGAYLWANRIIPTNMTQRAALEINAFFWAWAAAIVLGAIIPVRWKWSSIFAAAGLMLSTAPMPELMTARTFGGVDSALALAGSAMIYAAYRMLSKDHAKTSSEGFASN